MGVVIEAVFESAVTESNKDAFSGSCIENGKTVIKFDMRKKDWQKILKTESEIKWHSETYMVDVHEFSTFHNPIVCRFIMNRGYYFKADGCRSISQRNLPMFPLIII